MTASREQLAPLRKVEKGLGAGGGISQAVGDQGEGALLGDHRGLSMGVRAVEAPLSLLSPVGSHLAKQTLDLLDELEEDGLAQQDVDPRVEDGVEGGEAYRSQVRVLLQVELHRGFVELVQKHLSLQARKEHNDGVLMDRKVVLIEILIIMTLKL